MRIGLGLGLELGFGLGLGFGLRLRFRVGVEHACSCLGTMRGLKRRGLRSIGLYLGGRHRGDIRATSIGLYLGRAALRGKLDCISGQWVR